MTGRSRKPGGAGASPAEGTSGPAAAAGGAGAAGTPAAAGSPAPPEVAGVDLARVALRAAKEQARARGAAAQQKKQARRAAGCVPGPARTAVIRSRWAPRSTG
ncbi:hypothetical protein Smic_39330 [Streptomyces microflavus]|uniref:Uncharacterized protein n=1 Tax=Streptomyces microflavus TaxID=1919 RepID=A0A7J0CUA6_STRMI|nr:hypothetical protein Smic_39330 [Streptomyces microflavus]